MPKKKTDDPAVYIYSSNNELQRILKTLQENSRLTYRQLLRQMIEEVSASDKLREKVAAYYRQFGPDWETPGPRTIIRISQDENTIALASVLAFELCGTGSVAKLARLLVRFYATERKMELQPTPTHKKLTPRRDLKKKVAVSNIVPIRSKGTQGIGGEPKIAMSFNLDIETDELLRQLMQVHHKKGNHLVSFLAEKYAADEKHIKAIRKSVVEESEDGTKRAVLKRINLTEIADSLITHLSFASIGSSNKSAMIRALIRLEAAAQKLRIASAPKLRSIQ
ncbi:hypothetical protein [Edaphobacter modestus]|uniref:Uncharacterized protein n=1 Tax=Edaphobacter modestus TaxID=388466 RepID=A0A4Q7XYQ1_9BACT|nr:hypothetical protein [Edaphobacter modestus]RZU29084.1 hypothetical protein BDD14_6679 [Edaphobacter modestus]